MKIYKIAKENSDIANISGNICKIEINDIPLHGILYTAKSDHACLFIHGTASNFYENDFVPYVAKYANDKKIAFLSSNNRGSEGLKVYPIVGACVEIFEDCVEDIDSWINFLKKQGFSKISLIGHSLGSEKVCYYMSHGKNVNNVINVVLAGFCDCFQLQKNYVGNRMKTFMSEAKKLIKDGKGDQFLTTEWMSHSGILPQSAKSFVNFYSDGSELSKALPLGRNETLELLQNITVPVLGTIGDHYEYTVVSISEAIKRLKNNNENIVVERIKNADHDYYKHEEKVAKVIIDFCSS